MSDLIDRQAAIDATWFEPSYTDPLNVLTEVRDRLKALPSAEPKRIKGKWITDKEGYVTWSAICNKCGARTQMFDGYYNFCPHCGVKMR